VKLSILTRVSSRRPIVAVVPIIAAVLIFGIIRFARSAPTVPTIQVQRKEFVEYSEMRGTVKALRSITISAPASAGDLQILDIVASGSKVKKGDVIVSFDATALKQSLAQDRSALKSADAEIQQAKVAASLKKEQDLTDIMKARFEVESARMETQKQEILSLIEGQKAKLALNDAEEKLAEVEAKLKSDRASSSSNIASNEKKRDAALFQVHRDETQLVALALRAPNDGIVVLENNWQNSGPMQAAAPFKAGDHTSPGTALAQIPDTSTLRISARVEEAQRGKVQLKQAASIRVDAVPDRSYNGVVDEISSSASMDFNSGWPFPKNFSMGIALNEQDPRLTPGMGAVIRVDVDRVANGLVLPSTAVFRKEGRTLVYVRRGSRFDETVVEVARRSGDETLIGRGVSAGEQVALKDPTVSK
jgi:HlyD family secretion protein